MKGGADAESALDVDFSGVLLNDAVTHREPETCPAALAGLGRGLGSKERVINAFEMFGRDAGSGVGDNSFDMTVGHRGNTQFASLRHGVLGIEQQVEKDLLQLAGI